MAKKVEVPVKPVAKSAKAAPVTKSTAKKAVNSVAAKAAASGAKTAQKTPAARPAPTKVVPAKAATAKAAPTSKSPAKATSAKAPPAKAAAKSAPAASTAAGKASPPTKKAAPTTMTNKAAEPVKKAAAKSVDANKEAIAKAAAIPVRTGPKKAAPVPEPPAVTIAPVRGETKDGIKYTKDFDAKFLTVQRKLLLDARESLTGQAVRLEDEANSLIDDEMGDVQFDDESGEGDTMVVERERDLFLSARARQDIEEIDAALERLRRGTYGYSIISMRPIPRERLEAIPWATELTEEKVGGIGRR